MHVPPGPLYEFFKFDPAAIAWSDITAAIKIRGAAPTPRFAHGFAEAGGRIYMHGGSTQDGGSGELVRGAVGGLQQNMS